jgi:hypothetical protein
MAAMIAVMANIRFRMVNSFAMMRAGRSQHANRSNSPRAASFPEKDRLIRGNFRDFLRAPEPVEAARVCLSQNRARGMKGMIKCRHFDSRTSPKRTAETF